MPVRFLIALLFLVLANGQQYHNIRPESSSPTPDQPLSGMKEYLLYLTPDQVQTLQSKGADVRPYFQLENTFLQQQYQQSVKESIGPQGQTVSSNEDRKFDKDLDEIYKALYNQQTNEALGIQKQSTENPIEIPRPKYKLTSKPRKQEYASLYVPKKSDKTKSHSTEYIRYLPSYETEVLNVKPYRAQPLPGYSYGTDGAEGNLELPSYSRTEPQKESGARETPKRVEYQRHEEAQEHVVTQTEEAQKPVERQRYVNFKIHGDIQGQEEINKFVENQQLLLNSKPFDSLKQLQIPSFVQSPEEIRPIIQIPMYTITIGPKQQRRPTFVQPSSAKTGPVIFKESNLDTVKNQEVKTNQGTSQIQPPPLIENQEKVSLTSLKQPLSISPPAGAEQYSTLLAPLLQHEKISESIAQQKELMNSERAIHFRLKQIKESGSHDEATYHAELDKLKQNLGQQNILAEKLAYSKKPQGLAKEENALRNRQPFVSARGPELVQIITPRPNTAVWSTPTPIPVPIFQHEKNVLREPESSEENKAILFPRNQNTYNKEKLPYLWQKIIAANQRQRTPFTNPMDQRLIILRPIWEH